MKHTFKTAIVNAVQWFPFQLEPQVRTIIIGEQEYGTMQPLTFHEEKGDPHLHSQQLLLPGDYIVTFEDGETRVYRKKDFERLFTPHFDELVVVFVDVPPIIELLTAYIPFVN